MDKKEKSGIEFIETLSGGNHELFHSNLLAYIARNYKEYFKSVFNLNFDYVPKDVNREKNYFDISIFYDKKYRLVIENKMKSFPDIKQLEGYDEKIKRQNKDAWDECRKILLTMTPMNKDIIGEGWEQVTYQELSEKLKKGFPHLSTAPSYLGEFLEDYIAYIDNLSVKMEEWKRKVTVNEEDNPNDADKQTFSLLRVDSNSNQISRWESLFRVKFQFDCIGDQIKEKLKYKDYCQIGAGVVRGTPLLEFAIRFKNGKILTTEETKDEKDLETYWIQAYAHEIERGFIIKYDVKHLLKDKSKEERTSLIEDAWEKCRSHKVFEKIGKQYFDEKYFDKENFKPKRPENKRKARYRAYLYDEAAMVYYVEETKKDKNKDMKISDFIDKISEEINSIIEGEISSVKAEE